ncbi:MAG: hypothetical protein EZS28_047289, partial [Streblomastix strix]
MPIHIQYKPVDTKYKQKDKECIEINAGESKCTCQLHWQAQLSESANSERWPTSQEIQQGQILGNIEKRVEQLVVYQPIDTARNLLMEKDDRKNKTIKATIHQPQAILTTDASATNWGVTLKLYNPEEEISKKRITAFKIDSDNSLTSNYLNGGPAAVLHPKLSDKILEKVEDLGLQIQQFHIYEIDNTILHFLSRLATSGDYTLRSEVLLDVLSQFQVKPTIDMLNNRRNRKFKRFMSVTQERWAVTQDSLSMSWKSEIPYLHPPIPLIPATLSKLKREGVQALLIVPNLLSQPWWPELKSLMSRFKTLGK